MIVQKKGGYEKTSTRKEVLESALEIVTTDREEQYGSPEDNFKAIASMWSILFNADITPSQVAMAMICLKIARQTNGNGKIDNWVDIAGYAACGAELSAGDGKDD